jgi:hypothetical protein
MLVNHPRKTRSDLKSLFGKLLTTSFIFVLSMSVVWSALTVQAQTLGKKACVWLSLTAA